MPIQSPVAGTVTARIVNSGEIIQANKELFKITNLGTVWVIAEVYEKDLPQILAYFKGVKGKIPENGYDVASALAEPV